MSIWKILLGIVIAIPLTAIIALAVLLDRPDIYRDRLSSTFQEQTGYDLQINGDISWRYFPPIAINISDIAVTPVGLDIPLAKLGSASVDLQLMPLIFGGNVAVDGISIDGVEVNAMVDANGMANWEVTSTEADEDAGSADSEEDTDVTDDEARSPMSLDIQSISITNAVVNYQDLTSNGDYRVELTSLTTGAISSGSTFPLEAEFSLEDKTNATTVSGEMNGRLGLNETFDKFSMSNLNTTLNIDLPDMPAQTVTLSLTGDIDTSAGSAELSSSSLSVARVNINFNVKANNIFDVPGVRGSIDIPAFNAANTAKSLGVELPAMANPTALSNVALKADIKGTTEQLVLSNLSATLDNTNMTGNLTATIAPGMAATFTLALDQFDANSYLPPPSDAEVQAETTGKTPTPLPDSEVIPVELLTQFGLEGKVTLDSFNYDTWELTDTSMTIKNGSGKLDFALASKAYQGEINIGANLTDVAVGKKPKGTTTFSVAGVDIPSALEFESITGKLTVDSKLTFTGPMMSDVVNTLDGSSQYAILEGTMDVTPIKRVAGVVDAIQGTTSSVSQWPDMLPFNAINGKHIFSKGIGQQIFNAALENISITGEGGIDYFNYSMDYDVAVYLEESVGGQFEVNKHLAGIRWPMNCKGSLDDSPADFCSANRSAIGDVVKDIAKQQLKDKGKSKLEEVLKDKLPDNLKEGAGNLLKNLFN